jgi:hypothetical protein
MNALHLRDNLFSEIHQRALKGNGFKKRGHWSIRERDDLVQSFYLRASRWGSAVETTFWIDVQVFSRAFHNLLFAPKPYMGPAEGQVCVLMESLERMIEPQGQHTFKIGTESEVGPLVELISQTAERAAIPLLDASSNLTGLLAYWESKPANSERFLTCAALLRLMSRDEEARVSMAKAKSLAVDENESRWLLLREQALWKHAA